MIGIDSLSSWFGHHAVDTDITIQNPNPLLA